MRTVRDALSTSFPVVAHGRESVREVVKKMVAAAVPAIAIVDDARVVGVFTERDLMTRVVHAGLDPDLVCVEDVMGRGELPRAEPDELYDVAIGKMRSAGRRNILVVHGDVLVGVATLPDVVLLGLSEKDDEVRMLESYVYYFPPALTGQGGANGHAAETHPELRPSRGEA